MTLRLRPLHPLLVAEADGVDLRRPLEPQTLRAIEQAMDRYAMLVWHEQPLTEGEQVAFSRQFGPLDMGLRKARPGGHRFGYEELMHKAGEERVRKLLKEQKITDYWKMHGPRETMRYVPRIIAAKEIYSQPEKYLGLSKKDLYIPLETETITVNVKESQRALTSIAEEFGTYFLELKMLNPEFKKDVLPHGTYQIRVPRQSCPNRCFKQEATP